MWSLELQNIKTNTTLSRGFQTEFSDTSRERVLLSFLKDSKSLPVLVVGLVPVKTECFEKLRCSNFQALSFGFFIITVNNPTNQQKLFFIGLIFTLNALLHFFLNSCKLKFQEHYPSLHYIAFAVDWERRKLVPCGDPSYHPAVWLQQHGGGVNVSGAETSVVGEKGSGYSCLFHFQDPDQVTDLSCFFARLFESFHFCEVPGAEFAYEGSEKASTVDPFSAGGAGGFGTSRGRWPGE